jgi:hypothetical protein
MRKKFELQLQIGQVDIADIHFDLRSRDEIPKILIGLQHVFTTPELQEKAFEILEAVIPDDIDKSFGRPGMFLWNIFVLACLRVNCNWDFDKIREIANQHHSIRLMLGHGIFDEYCYSLQSVKDNFALLTPTVIDQLNQLIVQAGHDCLPSEEIAELKGQCDSWVVETDVHYPTNNNLLFDAIRKAIAIIAYVCFRLQISGWRQWQHHIKTIKGLFNGVRKLRKSSSKNKETQAKRDEEIRQAYEKYLDHIESLIPRIEESLTLAKEKVLLRSVEVRDSWLAKIKSVEEFVNHAKIQIDQIRRRIFNGETIPHIEKIFSVFETQTEWISKGKAGVSQELGLRVAIVKDQFGFILTHVVMRGLTDDKIAISITQAANNLFANLIQCSYDKGFWSPENFTALSRILKTVILPKKGGLSKADKERQCEPEFVQGRCHHPAVESAINALENHGLDRCLDHGIDGFDRYISIAVVARNMQQLGHIIQQQRLEALRKEKLPAAEQLLVAA